MIGNLSGILCRKDPVGNIGQDGYSRLRRDFDGDLHVVIIRDEDDGLDPISELIDVSIEIIELVVDLIDEEVDAVCGVLFGRLQNLGFSVSDPALEALTVNAIVILGELDLLADLANRFG